MNFKECNMNLERKLVRGRKAHLINNHQERRQGDEGKTETPEMAEKILSFELIEPQF
jgi:hypothetical protein